MTVGDLARAAAVLRLRAAGCVFAEDEAAILVEAARDDDTLAGLVVRRAAGEPLEQVVGYADFAGIRVGLLPGVFVPRVRSELLVRLATEAATAAATEAAKAAESGAKPEPPVVVDLCCGSGALGLAVRNRRSDIDLHAADLDPTAVACARRNLPAGTVHQGDLFDALPRRLRGRIDVLIANVPYVATGHIPFLPGEARDHEPRAALDGGADGLDVFRAVVAGAGAWLAPAGTLLSEITDAQATAATAAATNAGLDVRVIYDDDLDAQVIQGIKKR